MSVVHTPEAPSLLTVNGGSSSVKLGIFRHADPPVRMAAGTLRVTGDIPGAVAAAIQWVDGHLERRTVSGIGHRVVLSARRPLIEPVTPALLATLRDGIANDPEHLPLQLALIEAFSTWAHGASNFACSDSAFHETMPPVARLLPLPLRLRAIGFERIGFHGLSCMYLMEELQRTAGIAAANGRVILAHLGNGASMTAVHDGRSVDTSMSFTPTGGLVMGSRSGDLDAGLVAAICRADGLSPERFNHLVTHQSGLLGVSGTTGDVRQLLSQSATDPRAAEAVELFCYQARKWVGALATVLGGLDTLVFAGGVGEHLPEIRERICRGLGFLDVHIDPARNARNQPVINPEGARVAVRVISTDEEAMIARAVGRALGHRSNGEPS